MIALSAVGVLLVSARRLGKRGLPHLARPAGICAAVIILLVLLRWMVIQPFHGEGPSMLPTLPTESTVLVDKAAFGLRLPWYGYLWHRSPPKPGDVVVFDQPIPGSGDEYLLKRVVAGGGDKVSISGERVSVNGVAIEGVPIRHATAMEEQFGPEIWSANLMGHLHEVRLRQSSRHPVAHSIVWTVPHGYIFVVGDNRGQSYDSREFGPVSINRVIGRVVGVWTGSRLNAVDASVGSLHAQ